MQSGRAGAVLDPDPRALTAPTPLHDVLRAAGVPMVITSSLLPDNPVVFVNEAFCELTGYSTDELVGRNLRMLQGPETDMLAVARLREAVAGGHPIEIDICNRRKNGEPFWNRLVLAPVQDAAGTTTHFFCMPKDVTAQRKAALRLELGEHSLKLATDAAGIGTWARDIGKRSLTWSDRTRAMFGIVSPGEVTSVDFYACIHPDDRADVRRAMDAATDPTIRAPYEAEFRVVRPVDGRISWISSKGIALFDGDACERLLGTCTDITERRQASERQAFMLALWDRLRTLTQPHEIMYAAACALGRHLGVNRVGYGDVHEDGATAVLESGYAHGVEPLAGSFPLAMFGSGKIQCQRLGKTIVSTRLEPDPQAHAAAVLLADARAMVSVPLVRDDGLLAFLYVTSAEPRDWSTEDVRLIEDVAARTWDAVQRARAEAADQRARRSAEAMAAETSAILGQLSEGVIVADIAGRITFVNEAAKRLHGTGELAVGPDSSNAVFSLLTEQGEPYPAADRLLVRAVRGETVVDARWRIRRAGGRETLVIGNAGPLLLSDGRQAGAVLTVRDDTARRAAEAELAELNDALEDMVAERTRERDLVWRLSPDLFGICGFDGRYRQVNPAWSEITGLPAEEILQQLFGAFTHPDDAPTVADAFARMVRGEVVRDMDTRLRTRGGSYRWFNWTLIPQDGEFYAAGRDLTERRRLEDELRQSQKMEAVGQLTGGLAHDFNNLLTGIAGSLEVLQARVDQGRLERLGPYIAAAQDAATRAMALTHRLLAFSRRQTLDPQPTDVGRLAGGIVGMVRRTMGPSIGVEVRVAEGLWSTLVDPSQLENALLNLCINARDAMPGGGRLTIAVDNEMLKGEGARRHDLPPGDYVALRVSDTGAGMTAETARRAFDPFFTTKKLGEGTGLGLSMIHGFARQSGGHVRITSKPGAGTTVAIHLPRHATAEATPPDSAEPLAVARRSDGLTVLVVDDEPTVRMLVCEILEGLGHEALEAADAATGLRLLHSDARIDLLVTDVGLPGGMNGRQMVDATRKTRPDLKVLFITGYAETDVFSPEQLGANTHVLSKPFSMRTLASRIRELIPES
jgi:PAS domain S-box-containing protein